ncbi:Protein archease-like protein [Thelohanellus kitauei]|uniref:Protein archease-like protein n=1 Tax=Thelohanellus kitauei TaxID=669202 RepID=A0A0C2M9F4_THEKT|nr:Protein archease-like protein [Thelohanellus kitauei]
MDESGADYTNQVEDKGYDYLDHTADVIIDGWGKTLCEAFEMAGVAICGYMTDLSNVSTEKEHSIQAEGHDLESLLFNFMNEILELYSIEEYFLTKKIEMTLDETNFKITAKCYGENFLHGKHVQGTEIKAITYSNMQISNIDSYWHVYVVVDI